MNFDHVLCNEEEEEEVPPTTPPVIISAVEEDGSSTTAASSVAAAIHRTEVAFIGLFMVDTVRYLVFYCDSPLLCYLQLVGVVS